MTLHEAVAILQHALEAGKIPERDVPAVERTIFLVQILAGAEG